MFEAWVRKPILNLRREPVVHDGRYWQDPLQETQLLAGERVRVHAQRGEWVQVEALEQTCYKGAWQGYPGWVLLASLSQSPISRCPFLEGRVHALQAAIPFARRWLGTPYLWGGRSPYGSGPEVSGVDCSGLVQLAYLHTGRCLPRDAHDQWRVVHSLPEGSHLETGDLIFLQPLDSERMDHVMLYAGGNQILEATSEGGRVREVSGELRLGVPVRSCASGQVFGRHRAFLGRFVEKVSADSANRAPS